MGQARDDVTGIALSRTGSPTANSNALGTFSITFRTSTGGASFLLTKIDLYSGTNDTVDFSFNSGFSTFSSIASTNTGGISTFNFMGSVIDQTLAADAEYTLYARDLTSSIYGTSNGEILAGVSPLNFSGTQTVDHTTDYYTKFELYASVPEPGTMILTGTAMVGGMVGAWWKRRQQKSQTPLVVG